MGAENLNCDVGPVWTEAGFWLLASGTLPGYCSLLHKCSQESNLHSNLLLSLLKVSVWPYGSMPLDLVCHILYKISLGACEMAQSIDVLATKPGDNPWDQHGGSKDS